jgi:hypothetical protein
VSGLTACLPLVAVLGLPVVAGVASDAPTGRAAHTAECVAALKVDAEDLAAKIRAGREELRPTLLARLEQGAAFIGNSYLDGNRDEDQAKAMLTAAFEAQKSLPATALAARQTACSSEAAQMLKDASGFGRAIVSWVAKKRMHKMLLPDGR